MSAGISSSTESPGMRPLRLRGAHWDTPVKRRKIRLPRSASSSRAKQFSAAHANADHGQAVYNGKCVGGHTQTLECTAGFKDRCLGCHMQQRSPAAYLTFTDHRIRVYSRNPKPTEFLPKPDLLP